MVSATPSYRSVGVERYSTLPFQSKLRTAPDSLAQHTASCFASRSRTHGRGILQKPVGDSCKICRVTRGVPLDHRILPPATVPAQNRLCDTQQTVPKDQ